MPKPSTGESSPKSRRRPAPPPDPGAVVLGIDLGATKVVSGLVAPDGRIVAHSGRQVHSNDGPSGVLRTLLRSAQSCLAASPLRPAAIGVAVAAQVDPRTGTVVHAPNRGWRDVPLARQVAEELGRPVHVLNDARAATIAEWRFGAGRGSNDFFCLFLGTGIGGSAVVGGRLLEGGTHALGEVGHMTIVVGGRRCHCPNVGCFEAYAGGWAIAERAQEAVSANPDAGRPLVQRAGAIDAISAQTLFQEYRAGDPFSGQLVRETERFLADGVIGVVNAFNPSVLILGGGLVAGLPELLPVIEVAVRARCQPSAAGVRIAIATAGEDAPLVGAAEYARTPGRYRSTPPRAL